MLKVFLFQLLVIFLYAISWFVLAVLRDRNDVADIAWGGGFVLAAITANIVGGTQDPRSTLIITLVIIWGFRLMLHISIRNHGKPEDHRYRAWREDWGDSFLVRSFLQVFLLQGFLLLIISLPVTYAITNMGPRIGIPGAIGCFVWLIGFLFEAVGDYQLLHFKKDPANKGRIMKYGLWRFTRHPNYFGEVTLWWGIFLICLPVPGSLWTVVGPLTITWLILRVSGTPLLEKRYIDNPEYADYIKKTSPFFPLPPKR